MSNDLTRTIGSNIFLNTIVLQAYEDKGLEVNDTKIIRNLEHLELSTPKIIANGYSDFKSLVDSIDSIRDLFGISSSHLLIEANFDKWSILREQSTVVRDIDLELLEEAVKAFSKVKGKHYNYKLISSNIISSAPIAKSKIEIQLNNYIFFFLINKFLEEFQDYQFIVFTGEMVWSGWLAKENFMRLLASKLKGDKLFVFDSQGILNHKIYNDFSKHKGLSIYQKSGLNINAIDNGLVQHIKSSSYIKDYSLITDDSVKVYKKSGDNHIYQSSSKLLTLQESVFGLSLDEECILNKDIGERVDFGEKIGSARHNQIDLIKLDLKQKDIKKNIRVIEGQFIKKGESLVDLSVLRGFMKKRVVATSSGKITLRYLKDGYIGIKRSLSLGPYRSPVSGLIDSVKPGKLLKVKSTNISMKLERKYGKDAEGFLVSFDELIPGQKNILLFSSPSILTKNLDLDFIVRYNIEGVVFIQSSLTDIERVKEKLKKLLDYISIAYIRSYANLDSRFDSQLVSLHGSYVRVSGSRMLININNNRTLKWIEALELGGNSTIKKASIAKEISYFKEPCYVRIEKIKEDGVVLVSNGKQIFESHTDNLIAYSNH